MKRILRFASDIHLEMFRESTGGGDLESLEGLFKFEKDAETRYFLAIPGDIGTVETLGKLFQKVSPVYERVFYVPGNHEYYNKSGRKDEVQTMDVIASKLQMLCQSYPNITFLDNGMFELDEYRIIGSTFWSRIDQPEAEGILMGMNDYRRIYVKSDDGDGVRLIDIADTNRLHEKSVRYVSGALQFTPPGCKNIVLTHHAPLPSNPSKGQYTSHPRFHGSPSNKAFQSDQSALIAKERATIKAWIFGHTHHSSQFYVYPKDKSNQVLIASNQHGYLFEKTGFNVNEGIQLD